jgi:hypothetical protein
MVVLFLDVQEQILFVEYSATEQPMQSDKLKQQLGLLAEFRAISISTFSEFL